jgi:hypothetical protein
MVTQPGKRKRLYLDITISVQGMYQPISVASVSFFRLLLKKVGVMLFWRDLSRSDIDSAIRWPDAGRLYVNLSNLLRLTSQKKIADFLISFDPIAMRKLGQNAVALEEQITNTGVTPSMASADDGYSTQQGREEVLGLGLKVVSIRGAKGKKLIEAQQWKSKPYRQARAERSAMESLVFTLKEGFEFGEMMRRTHKNLLAEMLEKSASLQYLSDHPGAEEAFRATRAPTGSGLTGPITEVHDH